MKVGKSLTDIKGTYCRPKAQLDFPTTEGNIGYAIILALIVYNMQYQHDE